MNLSTGCLPARAQRTRPTTGEGHQSMPFSFIAPRFRNLQTLCYCTVLPRKSAHSLFECNTDANLGGLEQILAVYPYDLAALDAGELPFFLRQGLRSREVKLHVVSRPNGCGHRKCNKYARLADIAASTEDKSVGFRYPYTYRPGNTTPALSTLLY